MWEEGRGMRSRKSEKTGKFDIFHKLVSKSHCLDIKAFICPHYLEIFTTWFDGILFFSWTQKIGNSQRIM